MVERLLRFVVPVLCLLVAAPVPAAPLIGHRLEVTLEPDAGHLQVTDTVTLDPAVRQHGSVVFELHGGLHPTAETEGVKLERVGRDGGAVPTERYRATIPPSIDQIRLRYGGTIRHALGESVEGVGRPREQTPGLIGPDGVFLSGSAAWYPRFGRELVHFDMTVHLPDGWTAISQGEGGPRQGSPASTVQWHEAHPQDDIYLVAGKYHIYQRRWDKERALVYLRQPDEPLATRYLDATRRYIQLFDRLFGPYPYTKFALVENFWETGYGMPSFTLLGPRVIRLPFIIHSSYPHEILHNWWGNGVYVNYQEGNWSEGLTAYLADHLLKEEAGEGAEYRRDNLQKYAEYVASREAFPLRAFRARHGEASQAIGYGKGLMFFHMLRLRLGDKTFLEGLRRFYRNNRFHEAAFADLQKAFEAVSGQDLGPEFQQWVDRTGAPALKLTDVFVDATDGEYRLHGTLLQTQPGPAYRLRVPIAIQIPGAAPHESVIRMQGKDLEFEFVLKKEPARVAVDPRFDVFRRLDPRELPPSLDRAFGGKGPVLVLPAGAPERFRRGYRKLASQWAKGNPNVEVRWDDQIGELPSDRPVWLLGWENRFRDRIEQALKAEPVTFGPARVRLAGHDIKRRHHSLVLVAPAKPGVHATLAWVATDEAGALPGLARKLPHYGKYSYLAFAGEGPHIVTKGQWPVLSSPLVKTLAPGSTPPLRLPPRPPLARLAKP